MGPCSNLSHTVKMLVKLVACAFGIVFSCVTHSFEMNTHSEYTRTHGLTPVSMMDDDLLFLSANNARDLGMSKSQQFANYQWLQSERQHFYIGAAAIRKLFQLSFAKYYPRFKKANAQAQNTSENNQTSPFKDINNYQFDVSNDKLMLAFHFPI